MKARSFIGVAALAVQFGSVLAIPANADYNDYAVQREALKRDPQTSAAPASNNAASGSLKGFSVAYDPISISGCRDFDTDFALLAQQGVGLIRVFDVGCNLGDAVTAAAKHNVKLMLGINDIENGALQTDLGKLISDVNSASVKFGPVDSVYICNECVNRGQSVSSVTAAVTSAKSTLKGAGFSGSVITVDTFGAIKDNPTLCSTSDFCGANIHPFFNADFTSAQAGKFVQDSLSDTKATNGNTRIVITETGWPHQGQNNGLAVPSPQDQKTALASIMTTLASTAVDVFLFQPFDANYKQPGDFGVEPFFGILNESTGALAF